MGLDEASFTRSEVISAEVRLEGPHRAIACRAPVVVCFLAQRISADLKVDSKRGIRKFFAQSAQRA